MKAHQPDYFLIAVVVALVIFGLVALSSASVVLSQENFGENYYYLKHQLFNLFIGLVIVFLVQKIPYPFWQKISLLLLILTFVLLILVLVPGIGFGYGGVERWITLGPLPSFQPSELAKLTFVIYLAAWLAKKREEVRDFFHSLIPFSLICLALALLIAFQPDISTLALILLTGGIVYFLAGAKISHVFLLGSLGIAGLLALIKILGYGLSRLTVYLRPEIDPQGIGYQMSQALLAIGSGGLWGKGLGVHGVQKWGYLPETIGDSIFAIIAEEMGFIWVTVLIILFVLFALRGFKIAKNAPDKFSHLVTAGITFWIVFQAFIHMATTSALIPMTGIPLPFISYGGSALVISLIGVGVLVNISKYTR